MSLLKEIINRFDELNIQYYPAGQEDRVRRSIKIRGQKGTRTVSEFVDIGGANRDVFVTSSDGVSRDATLADLSKLNSIVH